MPSTDYEIKYSEAKITVTEIYKTAFSLHITCVRNGVIKNFSRKDRPYCYEYCNTETCSPNTIAV